MARILLWRQFRKQGGTRFFVHWLVASFARTGCILLLRYLSAPAACRPAASLRCTATRPPDQRCWSQDTPTKVARPRTGPGAVESQRSISQPVLGSQAGSVFAATARVQDEIAGETFIKRLPIEFLFKKFLVRVRFRHRRHSLGEAWTLNHPNVFLLRRLAQNGTREHTTAANLETSTKDVRHVIV